MASAARSFFGHLKRLTASDGIKERKIGENGDFLSPCQPTKDKFCLHTFILLSLKKKAQRTDWGPQRTDSIRLKHLNGPTGCQTLLLLLYPTAAAQILQMFPLMDQKTNGALKGRTVSMSNNDIFLPLGIFIVILAANELCKCSCLLHVSI